MNENIMGYITDCNNVRIDLTSDDPLDVKVFFLEDSPIMDLRSAFLRTVKYIQVISGTEPSEDYMGRPEQRTTLKTGKFEVVPSAFFDTVKAYLQLQRIGIKWKSAGKEVNAGFVKKKVQDALVPFGIKEKEITALYKQLCIHCIDSEAVVEPFEIADLTSHEYPEPTFIIDGLMCPGLILFAAPFKTGKSFLCLDLACCVAEGKPFWGFKTDGGSVLYLDLEGNESRAQKRFLAVGRKSKLDKPKKLDVVLRKVNTVDTGLIQQLESWIRTKEDAKLIIIDTLEIVKGKAGKSETAYSADYRMLMPLHDFAISKNVALIVVTHTRKGTGYEPDDKFDKIIGSTGQMGASDAIWLISGKRNEPKKTFTANGRDSGFAEFEIESKPVGKEGIRWSCNGTTEAIYAEQSRNEYQEDPTVKVVRQIVSECGGTWRTTAKDVWEEVAKRFGTYPATDPTRMSKRLRELAPMLLENDGILVRLPDKSGGKNGRIFVFEQTPFVK